MRLTKKHACVSNTKYKKDKTKIIEVKKQVLKYNIYIEISLYIYYVFDINPANIP